MHLAFSAFISAVCLIGFVHSNSLPYELSERKNGSDVPTISIVGGTPAAAGEFRDITVLRLDGSLCGGTLIARSAVLTAAHCVSRFTNTSVNTFTVYLNTLSINGGGTGSLTRGVTKFYIHPSYNPKTQNNDVAILILNAAVTTITPVKLPSSLSTYENQQSVIAGWGTTSSGGSISSVLLKATVKIQPNTAVCAKQYSNFVAANMLCASAPNKDTCQGDSGGPIYVNGIQVGITSFGNGCALPNFAGVYTRVSTYLGWINTHLV